MFEKLPDRIKQATAYFLTPFFYPERARELMKLAVSNRFLVRELVFMTERRKWFEKINPGMVIDVGACMGAYAYAMRALLPKAWIYSFEPLEDHYQILLKNMGKDDRFQAFQTALGEQNGESEIWRSDFPCFSSILPVEDAHQHKLPHAAGRTKVTVPIARLDDFLERMTICLPALLKLEVQGYEAHVLGGAVETLKRVDYVLTEIFHQPLYEGQATFHDLYEVMREYGFDYGGCFGAITSPTDGSILQSDALFIRRK